MARARTIEPRGTSRVTGAVPAGSPSITICAPGGSESMVIRTRTADGSGDPVVAATGSPETVPDAAGPGIDAAGGSRPLVEPGSERAKGSEPTAALRSPVASKTHAAAAPATLARPQNATRPRPIQRLVRLPRSFDSSSSGGGSARAPEEASRSETASAVGWAAKPTAGGWPGVGSAKPRAPSPPGPAAGTS